VILIHGAGGDHLFWPPRSAGCTISVSWLLTFPATVKSEGVGHHTIDDYTGEVMGFIKALKMNAVVLAGHSMGSAIALKAAIRFPKKVLGLCLLGSGARLRVAPSILQSASDPSTFEATVRQIIESSFFSADGRPPKGTVPRSGWKRHDHRSLR